MKKYRIVIEFESDIDPDLAYEIGADAFAQLETIEDEDYGKYQKASYKVQEYQDE